MRVGPLAFFVQPAARAARPLKSIHVSASPTVASIGAIRLIANSSSTYIAIITPPGQPRIFASPWIIPSPCKTNTPDIAIARLTHRDVLITTATASTASPIVPSARLIRSSRKA